MTFNLHNRRIILVVTGGIAAYKTPDLVRQIRAQGAEVTVVLSSAAAQFVAPLSLAAVSGNRVYQSLWDGHANNADDGMAHIHLTRAADCVVVAPATANILAKMAGGMADDLASTLLLASNRPILVAPAMNVEMWQNPATVANVSLLRERGVHFVGPAAGELACGEEGEGRMAEPAEIVGALEIFFGMPGPLAGKKALVTSGPTIEPIDPVRYITNRSSGKQGHAIAAALRGRGADVTLVTGPTQLPAPAGVKTISVQTAMQMADACMAALPVDIAVCAAAVADWRVENLSMQKLKKGDGASTLILTENPDILAMLSSAGNKRPQLVVGFAAETDNVLVNATAKLKRKGCDWLVANQVGNGLGFDSEDNEVTLLQQCADGAIKPAAWPRQSKQAIAHQLTDAVVEHFCRSLS